MKTKILYKVTAGKKIQTWRAEREGASYRFISGQLEGKKTLSAWTTAKAKNVGRTNATTAEEQAKSEVLSAFAHKLKTGYAHSIEGAQSDERFMPMLAHKYSDYRDTHLAEALRGGETVYVQPKLDGARCIATRHGLISRKNTPFLSSPHIVEMLQPFFEVYPDAVLDGELYNHDKHDEFEDLLGLLRKTTTLTPEIIAESRRIAQYHVYDAAGRWGDEDLTKENFGVRHARLACVLETLDAPAVIVVPTWQCFGNTDKIDFAYEQMLAENYEGQMVRLDAPYRVRARSKDLLKRKEFEDAEYVVEDIQEGDGNAAGLAARALLHDTEGRKFASNIKGGRAFRAQLLQEKARYIGGVATVRYANLTAKGVPRFPRIETTGWYPGGRSD